ncbi:MAG: hypothetical protein JW913_07550 [Chitinispirillaceae bacterium]|nr:hypothetical protein [Chitinispirillaceae bacterium]
MVNNKTPVPPFPIPALQCRPHNKGLYLIRHYIRDNPARWAFDDEFNGKIEKASQRRSPWYVRMAGYCSPILFGGIGGRA